ncbi:FecR domain-containing protein [Neptunomonas qingdaonensis]|uniref:FecR family protein n=1 Tax=Neptunomonas qingdaonensis TaxID=1045558 RepID=A0A1I2VPT1_9GAMM|nr:FecR domain-containing protein [Neptunomonas qingdaonensis]SFG91140.1 FecR family protein [Neptunomonas qingdaonensis]
MHNLLQRAVIWLMFAFSVPVLAADWVYVVHPGDTLWDFSIKNLKNSEHWKDLQKINSIENPQKLQPGTRIRVPLAWVKQTAVDAEVVALHGEALLTRADKSVHKVKIGDHIRLGDQLDVELASTLSVKFADGSVATVHESSRVQFNHLSQYSDSGMVDTRFRLEKGRVDTHAIPAKGAGSRFEIQTPSAITAVRGTEFRTSVVDSDQISRVEVLKGKVAVKGQSTSRAIPAGYGTRVEPRKAPIAPVKLLPAPVLEDIPAVVREVGWSLRWKHNLKAKSYRIELSENAAFDQLLWSRVTENRQSILPDVVDGTYYVRVRGIDPLGIEGLSSVAKLVLDLHPSPPFLMEPANEEVFRSKVPVLRWTKSMEADAYRLQVSGAEDFSGTLLIDKNTGSQVSYSAEEIVDIGTYYWRVASISASQEQGPFSTVLQLKKAPVPQAPELSVSSEEKQITVLLAGESGQQYQVQVSEFARFNPLLLDRIVGPSEFSFDKSNDVQYFRVRTIESDGFAGPWSATQQIYPAQNNRWLHIIGIGILGILFF